MQRPPKQPGETDEEFLTRDEAYWAKVEESRARVQARRDMVARWRGEYQMKSEQKEQRV